MPPAARPAMSAGARAHLDMPITDPRLERRLRRGRRSVGDRAVDEAEAAGVPWTGDAEVVIDVALGERAAGVGAAVTEREDLAVAAIQQHLVATGAGRGRRLVGEVTLTGHPGPLRRGLVEDGVVHPESASEDEVATDVPACTQCAQAEQAEHPAAPAAAGAPAHQRRE